MRRRSEYGILILTAAFFLMFTVLVCNYLKLAQKHEYVRAAEESSFIKINAGDTEGTIFDRNFVPLTNAENSVIAVAVPSAVSLDELYEYAEDKSALREKYADGKAFAFRCVRRGEEQEGLTFFDIPVHCSDDTLAPHVVGYLSEGRGASGLEYAYDRILRGGNTENSVTYSTDGFGNILIGAGKDVIRSSKEKNGAVTTIDAGIQQICENAGDSIEKGAIVVTDVESGDILALASFPCFSTENIGAALDDEKSPLINRALYSYSVGSVFKLVTACEGINEELGGFVHDCSGSINVGGQVFHCHKSDGHGVQGMSEAIINSCNTYFIALSQLLDTQKYRSLAAEFGFGREIYLWAGMTASGGVLPTEKELLVPAELANFSFGQGRLTATPLQVNAMTCAIANGGELPQLAIMRGITVDGETVGNEKPPRCSRVMSEETSAELRRMMIEAVYLNEDSNACPKLIRAGAKTSTAQTGRFDSDGEELCHAWITGFFPSSSPTYAVTVLVEDGGYGNDSAAPVFARIVDGIMQIER
ncbi:MAG: penicillin-binding protein 2 [Ruminococcus sp.]|nr:penicillin-binding protein 2 [Ruminococcus sp.]